MTTSLPTESAQSGGIRQRALHALIQSDPDRKTNLVQALFRDQAHLALESGPIASPPEPLPGRPAKPELIAATAVPTRSPFTPSGHAALMHSICHIEFNAINLALDAIWRFDGMPCEFYRDWLQVAHEEAYHFGLIRDHLRALDHDYGDFPAHDGLWTMCEKTKDDIVARMALVPRTLEARGLDATPLIQAKLRRVATTHSLQAAALLDIILRDEVGHVAIGNRWYGWLCEQRGLDPVSLYPELVIRHEAPRPKKPLNLEARRAAGFSEAELRYLES